MMAAKSMFFLFVIIICVVLLISYAVTGNISFWQELGIKTGTLQIQGAAANVTDIFMNYTVGADYDPCITGSTCVIDSYPDGLRKTTVKATIYRDSGDCEAGITVIGSICNGTVASCRPGAGEDYPVTLIYRNQKWGGTNNNLYCNYTGDFDLQYFKHNGIWTVNVSALVSSVPSYNYSIRRWYDLEHPGYEYPYVPGTGGGSYLPLGVVKSNQWNFGLGQNVSKNTGNTRLRVTYNASNFTTSGQPWNISVHGIYPFTTNGLTYTFAIQNVSGTPFTDLTGTNYENMTTDYNNPNGISNFTALPFFPANGIRRCGSITCDRDENNNLYPYNLANYSLLWSLYIPPYQEVATYTNYISWNVSQY